MKDQAWGSVYLATEALPLLSLRMLQERTAATVRKRCTLLKQPVETELPPLHPTLQVLLCGLLRLLVFVCIPKYACLF